ncbi:copper transporter [Stackebrandtia soli]|uniref:copper transporter n=1 Tax=Stackebrandtia soli TaxID=1892856 RepID=UPI0039EA8D56
MINFRYHIVSVTAVFLALAIGLILGTAALNGPTVDALSDTVSSLRADNQALRDEVVQLEEDASTDPELASQIAPAALANTLEDERVLVLSIGSADPADVESVVKMLGYSKASVTGQLNFLEGFADPANSGPLLDVVKETTPPDVEPPNNANGAESVAGLLAAVLLENDAEITTNDRKALLTALAELQLVSYEAIPTKTATAVVIVAGKPFSDATAPEKNANVVTFADQFALAGPTVLAAPTTVGEGNPVVTVIADPDLTTKLSTVDNVSRPEGQLATVLALVERIGGDAGHYGTGDEATSLVPQP